MTQAPPLLPLGSAVQIEDVEGTYVVIARGFQKDDDGFIAGYKAVPHPQGAAAGVREIVIRGTQITKVLHRGHESEQDVVFAKEQLANAMTPPKRRPTPAAEPDLTVDLTTPATTTPSTSAPRPEAAPGEAFAAMTRDSKDPFSELRRKGRQQ
ncbi:DUF4176 domain-containing protein [Microbacteriaceae bacterium VKM Ac-2855]|nr:DUF4176 domain-containing protein [Microbacteriaceae bacterium VKM Ac-2855]